jgi:C4-type Zn-finger protein
MKKLATIAEHESTVFSKIKNKQLTGIECPNCKEELQFSDDRALTSYPPQRWVTCFSCNYNNTIYV